MNSQAVGDREDAVKKKISDRALTTEQKILKKLEDDWRKEKERKTKAVKKKKKRFLNLTANPIMTGKSSFGDTVSTIVSPASGSTGKGESHIS